MLAGRPNRVTNRQRTSDRVCGGQPDWDGGGDRFADRPADVEPDSVSNHTTDFFPVANNRVHAITQPI